MIIEFLAGGITEAGTLYYRSGSRGWNFGSFTAFWIFVAYQAFQGLRGGTLRDFIWDAIPYFAGVYVGSRTYERARHDYNLG